MASVFISHSSKDKSLAGRIARDLRQAGHRVWFDDSEIHVGHSYTRKIEQGLARTDFVVVLLTRHSVESGWVDKEWHGRLGREISERSVEVLPVVADDCEIPWLLRDKKCADIRNYRVGLDELLRALAHHELERRRSRGAGHWEMGSQGSVHGSKTNASDFAARRPSSPRFIVAAVLAAGITVSLSLCQSSPPTVATAPEPATKVPENAVPIPEEQAVAHTKPPAPDKAPAERTVAKDVEPREEPSRERLPLPPPSARTLSAFEVERWLRCWPTGCRLTPASLCKVGARTLRLGATAATEGFEYAVTCDGAAATDWDAHVCFSPGDEIFALRPGATVYGNIESAEGRTPFQIEVANIGRAWPFDDRDAHWVELDAIAEKNSGPAPFAAAQLQGRHLQVQVYLGAGGCPFSKQVARLLYDIDGRGLVEYTPIKRLSVHEEREDVISLPRLPKDNEIALAFERPSGQRVGPFVYRFDAMKAIRARGAGAGPPRLFCDWSWRDSSTIRCDVESGASALAWLGVRELQYGPVESELNQSHVISMSEATFLAQNARAPELKRPWMSIAIPPGWTDVYYRLVLETGETTAAIRLPLRARSSSLPAEPMSAGERLLLH